MRRLHPLVLVARAVGHAISGIGIPVFFFAMASVVFRDGTFDQALLIPIGGLGLLIGLAYGVLSYLKFTYEVTEDTFDLHSGVIARREREIPHRRVQNVDVTRSFWHRLLGVAVVRIETAGGGATEAELDFVSAEEATRLQRELRDRRAAARDASESATADHRRDPVQDETVPDASETDTTTPEDSITGDEHESRLLFRLRPVELFLYAASEIRPATLFLTALGTPLVDDIATGIVLSAAAPLGGPDQLAFSMMTPDELLIISLVAIPLWLAGAWLLGSVIALNSYYGFVLGRRGNDFVYERGLLSEYSGTIPADKVQTLTMKENVLQRMLGYAALSIETAGYSGQAAQQRSNRSSVPLASRDRTLALARAIEEADLDVPITKPPRIARRRYAVRFAIVVVVLLGISTGLARLLDDFSMWWVPALLLPLVPVAAHYRWKHRGYAVSDHHLLVRTGFWRRRTKVVPYDRLQTAVRTRSVFQRRLGLAHLVADTAGGGALARGGAVIYDISAETASDIRETLRARLQDTLHENVLE